MPGGDLFGTAFTRAGGRIRVGWRILLFLVLAALVAIGAGIVLPPGMQGGSAALLLGACVAGWVILALDGRTPDALGLYVGRTTAREAAAGLALGVAIGLVVVGAIALAGGVRWSGQPGDAGAWAVGAASALLYLTIPAAAEEALLRGYPLQALAEAVGHRSALIVTSLAFAALHLRNPEVSALALANLVAAGLLLGVVYLRTGSLWWATGVHLGWNWAHGYVADLPVSGLEVLDAPLYEGVMRGPEWLGGGGFGPEGSAVAIVIVLASALWLWRARWLVPAEQALVARPLALVGGKTPGGMPEEA